MSSITKSRKRAFSCRSESNWATWTSALCSGIAFRSGRFVSGSLTSGSVSSTGASGVAITGAISCFFSVMPSMSKIAETAMEQ